jgi:hypothetical protein
MAGTSGAKTRFALLPGHDEKIRCHRNAMLPLRFALLRRFLFLLRNLFLRRRSLRHFLALRPCLGKTDRDRLLAASDFPPRAAAPQSPGLALLHHPLDICGGLSRIFPCHDGSPGCGKTIFADGDGSHEARLRHRPGHGLPIQFSNSYVVGPDVLISGPSWFETRGVAALLTMRVSDLILKERAFARVSKDAATALENTPATPPRSRGARRSTTHLGFMEKDRAALVII